MRWRLAGEGVGCRRREGGSTDHGRRKRGGREARRWPCPWWWRPTDEGGSRRPYPCSSPVAGRDEGAEWLRKGQWEDEGDVVGPVGVGGDKKI
jgi:hypothetical protein